MNKYEFSKPPMILDLKTLLRSSQLHPPKAPPKRQKEPEPRIKRLTHMNTPGQHTRLSNY